MTVELNPQDAESLLVKGNKKNMTRNRKPSFWYMWARNNIQRPALLLILTFCISIAVHRLISLFMTHKKWANAPITYMHRTCPSPDYPVLQTDSNPNDNNNKSPTICLTTLTDQKSTSSYQRFMRWRNYDGIIEMTWANKYEYTQLHGYTLFDGSHLIDPSRPPAWSKITVVQHLLQQNLCDWVMWMDADTIIMNDKIPVSSFLPQDTTHDFLVVDDKGGGYNSGVFLFRNTEWSKKFLDRWWNMKRFVRPAGLSLSGDNAALKYILAEMETNTKDFHDHVLAPPRCTFNSFGVFLTKRQSYSIMDTITEESWYLSLGHYHKGDFIAHVPGMDNKAECLRMLLETKRNQSMAP